MNALIGQVRVHDHTMRSTTGQRTALWGLAGPPPMIESCAGWLAARGVDRHRVRAEKFLPSA